VHAAGLDSLGAVELRNTLESAFGVQLPPTLVFDFPTADAVAHCIRASLPPPAAADNTMRSAGRKVGEGG